MLTVNTRVKNVEINLKNRLYNEHYPSILVTFFGTTEHFSGRIGALRWSILVGKQKHNVQKPTSWDLQWSQGKQKQCLCKMWRDKQRVLWYFRKWPVKAQ